MPDAKSGRLVRKFGLGVAVAVVRFVAAAEKSFVAFALCVGSIAIGLYWLAKLSAASIRSCMALSAFCPSETLRLRQTDIQCGASAG